MNQDQNNSRYRIKKQRNNFLFEEGTLRDDDDVFKISIHSNSNQTPTKSPEKRKKNTSTANRLQNIQRFSSRSKNYSHVKSNQSRTTFNEQKKKKQENARIKQFANVKQLLMIKVYDKKLLRKVTTSNEANKNFLKLGDVRNDPFRKQTFKVMIQNFKELVIRIRNGYDKVLSKILFQNTNSSAIVTLASVQPILQKVRSQADYLHEKVRECQETLDSREFRTLLLRFETFLNAFDEIQDIILIVDHSKQNIDNIFKNLQKDRHLDDKVNNERKKGIKKIRNAVKDYGNDGVQAQILNRVEAAINEMADKTLQAYSKIMGARGIMGRIKDCLRQNKQSYELDDIVKINKIFKEVLVEADTFERFADRFLQNSNDTINDDLRDCIFKYREEVQVNKQAMTSMELKFISNILQTSVQSFQANYSVCNAIQSTIVDDHIKIEKLLESICENLSDQTSKATIIVMLRDIRANCRNMEKLIKKMQKFPKNIVIDSQQGLQKLVQLSGVVNQYKKSVREIIQREERAYRQINKRKIRKQIIDESDLEQASLERILKISNQLNRGERKHVIRYCQGLQQIDHRQSIFQLAQQIGEVKLYKQMRAMLGEVEEVRLSNEVSSIISSLELEQKLYEYSQMLVEMHEQATSVTQSNLLNQLNVLCSTSRKASNQSYQRVQLFIDRVFCLALVKGLEKKTAKKVDNHQMVQFPVTQHDVESLKRDVKYLSTVIDLMMNHLIAKQRLSRLCAIMRQFVEGVKIVQNIKWNKDNLYFVNARKLFAHISEYFEKCFLNSHVKEKQSSIVKLLKREIQFCNSNLQKLQNQQRSNKISKAKADKILNVITKYKTANTKFYENVQKIEKIQMLECYSQLIYFCCQYLQSTIQSFHAFLNKNNSPFWICQYSQALPKNCIFGKQIGLASLKMGQIAQKYNQKNPIKARKQAPIGGQKFEGGKKKSEKKSIKNVNETDKQIISESGASQVADQMDQQIDEAGQAMQEAMEDNIQQMEEDPQMGEQIDDYIMEVDDNIIDDGVDDLMEQLQAQYPTRSNKPSTAKERPTTSKKSQTSANTQSPVKGKPASQLAVESHQQVVIKQRSMKKILEIFNYIDTLEDLQVLINKIANLENMFWKSVDLKQLESYFNLDTSKELQKDLTQMLSKFCQETYPAQFGISIRESSQCKDIHARIDALNSLKFAQLAIILAGQKIPYSCLMGVGKQLLRLSLKTTQQWRPQSCIAAYIYKQLAPVATPTFSLSAQNFSTEEYTSHLIKQSGQLQTRYELPHESMMIMGLDLRRHVEQIWDIIKQRGGSREESDEADLYAITLQMWHNCICADGKQVRIDLPAKLQADKTTLSIMRSRDSAVFYLRELRGQAQQVLQDIEAHQRILGEVLGHIDKSNLLCKIGRLVAIYECSRQSVVTMDERPLVCIKGRDSKQRASTKVNTPQMQLLKYLLGPEESQTTTKAGSNCLTVSQLRFRLKRKPQLYAEHRNQICKMLSILQAQSHIWPSQMSLEICSSRNQAIAAIVREVSNGVIKDGQKQLENLPQILKDLIVVNSQTLVFEYQVKQGILKLNRDNNMEFCRELAKTKSALLAKRASLMEISDCIVESLFGLEDQDNSKTAEIFDYTETLSLLLKEQRVFDEKWETIFAYHTLTQNQLNELKQSIDTQVRMLVSLVEQPIDLAPDNMGLSLSKLDQNNEIVAKWYKQFKNKDAKDLNQISLCICGEGGGCINQYQLYVGETQHHLLDYIKQMLPKQNQKSVYEKYFNDHCVEDASKEYRSSEVLHLGKFLSQIQGLIKQVNLDMYKQFINEYNVSHLVKKETSSKRVRDLHGKLVKELQQAYKAASLYAQFLARAKKNSRIHSMLLKHLQVSSEGSLNELIGLRKEELDKLQQIALAKTQYNSLGNWIINVAGKLHKMPFVILMDKHSDHDLVCILMANTDSEIRTALSNLKLPTDYQVIETRPTHKKIKLNRQVVTVKLDGGAISQQELRQLQQQNYGIEHANRETLALGVYRVSDANEKSEGQDTLLQICYITPKLLSGNMEIEVTLSHHQISLAMELKVLEVRLKQEHSDADGNGNGKGLSEDSIIRELCTQKYNHVSLEECLTGTDISAWLKREHGWIVDRRNREKLEKQRIEKERAEQAQQQKMRVEQQLQLKKQKALAQQAQKEEERKKNICEWECSYAQGQFLMMWRGQEKPTQAGQGEEKECQQFIMQGEVEKEVQKQLDSIYKQVEDRQFAAGRQSQSGALG